MFENALIYGKNGQLATCLGIHANEFDFNPINISRATAPLNDFEKLQSEIFRNKPDILINASAFNDVDGAQSQNEAALQINAYGPQNLATIASQIGIPVIHVSTDYVFDGEKGSQYCEVDATGPINFYGKTKLIGEELVAKSNPNHAIVRTSWVYSEFANNFPKRILQIACDGRETVSIVDVQFGSPTSSHDLARAILTIARNLLHDTHDKDLRGVFHYASRNPASRYEFTKYIFQIASNLGARPCEIVPVKADFFQTPAKRPKNTSLNCDLVESRHGVIARDWQLGIDEIIEKILKAI